MPPQFATRRTPVSRGAPLVAQRNPAVCNMSGMEETSAHELTIVIKKARSSYRNHRVLGEGFIYSTTLLLSIVSPVLHCMTKIC